jgi:hypothetical protein
VVLCNRVGSVVSSRALLLYRQQIINTQCYSLIVVHKKDHLQPTLEKVLHALCWGVPAIQTIVPLIFHKFEDRLVWYAYTW